MRRALALLMAIWLAVPAAADTIHRSGPMPEPLYVGQIQFNVTIRAQMSREAEAVGYYSTGDRVYILDYEPEWLHVVKGEDGDWMEGYILRHAVDDVKRLAEDHFALWHHARGLLRAHRAGHPALPRAGRGRHALFYPEGGQPPGGARH